MPSYLIWKCLLVEAQVCCYFQNSVGGGAIALATHWPSVQEMPLCLIVSARQIINPRTERKAVHPPLPSCL